MRALYWAVPHRGRSCSSGNLEPTVRGSLQKRFGKICSLEPQPRLRLRPSPSSVGSTQRPGMGDGSSGIETTPLSRGIVVRSLSRLISVGLESIFAVMGSMGLPDLETFWYARPDLSSARTLCSCWVLGAHRRARYLAGDELPLSVTKDSLGEGRDLLLEGPGDLGRHRPNRGAEHHGRRKARRSGRGPNSKRTEPLSSRHGQQSFRARLILSCLI